MGKIAIVEEHVLNKSIDFTVNDIIKETGIHRTTVRTVNKRLRKARKIHHVTGKNTGGAVQFVFNTVYRKYKAPKPVKLGKRPKKPEPVYRLVNELPFKANLSAVDRFYRGSICNG